MFEYMNVVRALGDENRVRILMALRGRSLCVCQVTAFLDLAPSTTSKHLSILRQSRLIEGRKQGRWVYYQLAGNNASPLVRSALDWTRQRLEHDPSILRDEAHIADIIRAEEACGLASDECLHAPELHALDAFRPEDDCPDGFTSGPEARSGRGEA